MVLVLLSVFAQCDQLRVSILPPGKIQLESKPETRGQSETREGKLGEED